MQQLKKGEFFGKHYHETQLDYLTLTDTQYTHPQVDWHYHQNAYFTYLIRGELYEANKKETYEIKQGDLLFHHWQDPHFNKIKEKYTQGFHIEIEPEWFEKYLLDPSAISGSFLLFDPILKRELAQIYIESKIKDGCQNLSIESQLLNIFARLKNLQTTDSRKPPNWVNQLQERLHDQYLEETTLEELSAELNIHPVHLSRNFKKYFHVNLGEYVRMLRLNHALSLLKAGERSSTAIAYDCGFSDQSHFIRLFKRQFGLTPKSYQKNVLKSV